MRKAASRQRRTRPSAQREKRTGTREWTLALRRGRELARFVLDERRRLAARRRAARAAPDHKDAGLLLAVGDSWFDYPFSDVLEELEETYHYTVESVAHKGETAEEMAYDSSQLDKLARLLEKLKRKERQPKAILLSAGGNDIAGEEFAMLLNHSRSTLPTVNEDVVTGAIERRLRVALISLASGVTELTRRVLAQAQATAVLIHGYDYPVPDGRGYLGGFWLFPGPWLEPGFRRKGYLDLAERCRAMEPLIDRFNAVLSGIAGGPGLEHLRHVDLRGVLSNALAGRAYKAWWNDELHPTQKGFAAVAGRFDAALRKL